MTPTEIYLHSIADHFGAAQPRFILQHGRAFEPDQLTFKGWRGEPQNCFGNCAMVVLTKDPSLTYVEGFVHTLVPIHHAWLTRDDGTIIDPTIRLDDRFANAHAYFGVPFDSDFVRKFILQTQTFGLLDGLTKQSIALMTGKTKPSKFLAKTLKEAA